MHPPPPPLAVFLFLASIAFLIIPPGSLVQFPSYSSYDALPPPSPPLAPPLPSHTHTFPFPPPSAPSRPPPPQQPAPRCRVAGRFLYTARLYGMKHRPSWRCRARRQYAASASTSRGVTRRKPTTSRATQPPSVSRSEQWGVVP